MKTISIGGASGFWGDSLMAAPGLLKAPKLDYIVFDYLAEITMSILARAKSKDGGHGYALDFVDPVLKSILPQVSERGIKIVSNAGGVNPIACGRAIESLLEQMGLDLSVAVVLGDDLLDRAESFRKSEVREMYRWEPFPATAMSVNAYLGAFPIAEALGRGADIVVTGRCVDSAVTLGPCIHEFGWNTEDFDQLAGGSLAGHIIECGAQATGGLFTDWKLGGDWATIGYPIVEIQESGEFVVTKPEPSGGIVCRGSVAEQLVYEIGDPRAYILPDVVCDFSEVSIGEEGSNRVKVSGARGHRPTDKLKVCATYFDGFRIVCSLTIRGIDAAAKARQTFESVLRRVRGMLAKRGAPDFTETHIEILGVESGYGPHARVGAVREVVGRLGAKHRAAEALSLLLRELTSSGTSMSPGTTGDGSTRPKPSPVVRLFSFLVAKEEVRAEVRLNGESWEVGFPGGVPFEPLTAPVAPAARPPSEEASVEVPLIRLAYGRSGDKGNDANIGIIARQPEYMTILRDQLTADAVGKYFAYLSDGPVERYELPGIRALNFVLHNSLGGGGIASLRQDPQGKAYAQILLDYPIRVPVEVAEGLPE